MAVITGRDLEARGLAWMPTLSGDAQAVLATDKVRFQGQEVAFVIADDRYSARDALELIEVEYEPLGVVVDPRRALDPDAPLIRDDHPGRSDNHIFDWEAGDAARTEQVFADADVVVEQDMVFPRSHPAPMETCGAVAEFDRVAGKLTLWCDDPGAARPPHAVREILGLAEHRIRVISPDVGGGFGNKVPVYPGYVCAAVGAMNTGRPVKWMEDRSENLMSTGFCPRLHDARRHRRRRRRADPAPSASTCWRTTARSTPPRSRPGSPPASSTCSPVPTTLQAAHCHVRGVYTNKAPGGVAYACSFRVAEAVYLVERLVDLLAGRAGRRIRRSCGWTT